jgi:hypothetical protein
MDLCISNSIISIFFAFLACSQRTIPQLVRIGFTGLQASWLFRSDAVEVTFLLGWDMGPRHG